MQVGGGWAFPRRCNARGAPTAGRMLSLGGLYSPACLLEAASQVPTKPLVSWSSEKTGGESVRSAPEPRSSQQTSGEPVSVGSAIQR
uniref:Uncharacterized protein n=1 Tax=Rangifer tarandus platyrhynchus TaxID=3082113 RepID=A0ACB0FMB1_RANTA|nr:unnamed protein product [Rangifer tarandus platyrhynchus]